MKSNLNIDQCATTTNLETNIQKLRVSIGIETMLYAYSLRLILGYTFRNTVVCIQPKIESTTSLTFSNILSVFNVFSPLIILLLLVSCLDETYWAVV